MSELSHLEIRERRNNVGFVEDYDCVWHGPPGIVWLDDRHIQALGDFATLTKTKLTIGSTHLRVVNWCDFPPWGIEVMQDGFRAKVISKTIKIRLLFRKVYRRLIVTAAVWGLASYEPAKYPNWRDVYALDWIATKLRG